MANLNKTAETLNRMLGQKVKGTEREIAKKFANLLNDIRKELATYYERFEIDGKLTYAEMAKFDRLKKFNAYVDELVSLHYKDLKKVIYDVLGESYLDGYYLTAWALETDTLSKLAYSTVSAATIAEAIDNPLTNLSERIHKNMLNSQFEIRTEVSQGLVQGDTYGKMTKRLKNKLELKTYEAMRVVRTESHKISEASKLSAVEHANKNGVVMVKEWNSSQDERVRPGRGIGKKPRGKANHRKLNGVKLPVDGLFNDGLSEGPAPGALSHPGSSINCRCFLTYTVERIEKPDAKELSGMAFDTWKNERLIKK